MLMLFHDQEIFSSVHCNVRANLYAFEAISIVLRSSLQRALELQPLPKVHQ